MQGVKQKNIKEFYQRISNKLIKSNTQGIPDNKKGNIIYYDNVPSKYTFII